MRTAQPAGVAAITVTALLWGTTGTAATFAPEVGPLAIGAAALGIGGLLQAAIALPAIRSAAPALRARAGLVLFGAVAVAIYPLAFYSSMALAGVAVGSVASLASAPLASGVLERVLDRRPLSRWWMIAAAIGIVGAALLCAAEVGGTGPSETGLSDVGPSGTGHDGGAGTALSTLAGIGLGLIAGTSYASYSWVVHRLMAGGIRRSASMGAVFGIGGALLMPVLLVTGAPILESRESFLVATYMALVPMFLGYVLFGFGLTRVAPSTATTITLTEPAVATVLAVAIVGEALSPVGWAGLVCIAVVLLILAVAPANAVPARRRDEVRAPA